MQLELLRGYIEMVGDGHNHRPDNMTIGGFSVVMNSKTYEFDFSESYGDWDDNISSNKIYWNLRGGTDMFSADGEDLSYGDDDFHFTEMPVIESIEELAYEAFNEDYEENWEGYDFKLLDFVLYFKDCNDLSRDLIRIQASQEIINKAVTC